jgi:hypothetical protein
MERYLYFRTEATDASDDATGDSACWPASSFMGMQPTADDALTLYFKSMVRGSGSDPGSDNTLANLDNNDSVILTIPNNTHLVAMQAITHAIVTGRVFGENEDLPILLVIANDDSGGTEYLSGSGITACGTITAQAAYTN